MSERVTRLSAYTTLIDSGRVLLCRLAPGTSSPGAWTLPGGGLEFGEAPEDAVVREVAEETGLTLLNPQLIEVWSETEIYQGKQFHLIRFMYKASFVPSELRVEVDGSTDRCEWIALVHLDEIEVVPLVKRGLASANPDVFCGCTYR